MRFQQLLNIIFSRSTQKHPKVTAATAIKKNAVTAVTVMIGGHLTPKKAQKTKTAEKIAVTTLYPITS